MGLGGGETVESRMIPGSSLRKRHHYVHWSPCHRGRQGRAPPSGARVACALWSQTAVIIKLPLRTVRSRRQEPDGSPRCLQPQVIISSIIIFIPTRHDSAPLHAKSGTRQ